MSDDLLTFACISEFAEYSSAPQHLMAGGMLRCIVVQVNRYYKLIIVRVMFVSQVVCKQSQS